MILDLLMGKIIFSINISWKTDIHTQKNKVGPIYYTTHKNELNMDPSTQGKS